MHTQWEHHAKMKAEIRLMQQKPRDAKGCEQTPQS